MGNTSLGSRFDPANHGSGYPPTLTARVHRAANQQAQKIISCKFKWRVSLQPSRPGVQ